MTITNSMAYVVRSSMPHSQGLFNNPYPEPNQPKYPHWYLSNIDTILILSSHICLGHPKGLFPVSLPVIESTPTILHSDYMSCPSQSSRFNHPEYIRLTVQTMKFLIVEPFPLPIFNLFGTKYSPQYLFLKYLILIPPLM